MSEHLAHESAYRGDANIVGNRMSQSLRICGAGALGSHLVETLARQGYHGQVVFDKDKVEGGNLGTQNYSKSDIGRAKAVQCANNTIKRTGVPVKSVSREVTPVNVKSVVNGASLVIDLFDDPTSRRLLQSFCQESGVDCLHAGMSSDGFAEICWNEHYTVHETPANDDEIPCEYPLAANLVHFTVAMISETVNRYFDECIKQSLEFTLRDYRIEIMHESKV